jgi:hypothetical protein
MMAGLQQKKPQKLFTMHVGHAFARSAHVISFALLPALARLEASAALWGTPCVQAVICEAVCAHMQCLI